MSCVDDRTVIAVVGELDVATAPTLRSMLKRVGPDCHVVLDFSDVDFMDSSGLNVLVGHVVWARAAGGSLRVRNSPDHILRLVEMAGLQALLAEPNPV